MADHKKKMNEEQEAVKEEIKEEDVYPAAEAVGGDEILEEDILDEVAEVIVEEPTPKEDERIADLTQQLARLQADFTNFRKRADKERQSQAVFGIKKVVSAILPIIDNLERALATEQDRDPFYEGVELIYRQLLDALAAEKITPMDDVQKTFDPFRHHAVLMEDIEGMEPDLVAEILQQGYTYDNEDVIRPAMVKVSK